MIYSISVYGFYGALKMLSCIWRWNKTARSAIKKQSTNGYMAGYIFKNEIDFLNAQCRKNPIALNVMALP